MPKGLLKRRFVWYNDSAVQNLSRLRRLAAAGAADYTKATACPVNAASQRFPVCACGIIILLTQNSSQLRCLAVAGAADYTKSMA